MQNLLSFPQDPQDRLEESEQPEPQGDLDRPDNLEHQGRRVQPEQAEVLGKLDRLVLLVAMDFLEQLVHRDSKVLRAPVEFLEEPEPLVRLVPSVHQVLQVAQVRPDHRVRLVLQAALVALDRLDQPVPLDRLEELDHREIPGTSVQLDLPVPAEVLDRPELPDQSDTPVQPDPPVLRVHPHLLQIQVHLAPLVQLDYPVLLESPVFLVRPEIPEHPARLDPTGPADLWELPDREVPPAVQGRQDLPEQRDGQVQRVLEGHQVQQVVLDRREQQVGLLR